MAWIGGALSIGGALLQSDSAEDASASQEAGTRAGIEEQRRQYDLNRKDLAPYRNTGSAAIYRLSDLMGLGGANAPANNLERFGGGVPVDSFEQLAAQYGAEAPKVLEALKQAQLIGGPENGMRVNTADTADVQRILGGFQTNAASNGPDSGSLTRKFTLADFWDDPVTKASYQFGLDEGTKALDRMGGAKGSRNSGAQLKALARYATDYTGQQAGQSQARFVNDQTNLYNRYAGLAGTGQNAANTTVASGTNMANTVGGMLTAQGNARGAASIAGGNAVGGALTGAGNWYNQQRTLNQILNRGGTAGAGAPTGGGNIGDDWF